MTPPEHPTDYREHLPAVATPCVCGHDEDEHDEDGICQIKRCDCEEFRREEPA